MPASANYLAALRLHGEGETWEAAQTLVALSRGLQPVRAGWTLRELGELLFLRDLYQRYPTRLGIPLPDGISTPTVAVSSRSAGAWVARLRGHGR